MIRVARNLGIEDTFESWFDAASAIRDEFAGVDNAHELFRQIVLGMR
jgi:hypothetical protein